MRRHPPPSSPLPRALAAAAGVALLVLPLAAHDLWLVPPEGAVPGQAARVIAASGMDFPVSLSAIAPGRLQAWLYGPDQTREPLAGWVEDPEQKLTYAELVPPERGVYLVYAQTREGSPIDLSAGDFNLYLLQDGLPDVLAGRMEQGEMDRPAREKYTKYVKALVSVGGALDGEAVDHQVGQVLEILPRRNPLRAEPGQALAVEVRFRSSPLPGAVVCWDLAGGGEGFDGQTRSNADGVAWVPIPKAGLMTIRLVHMTRPRTPDYEWESFWASYTFRVQEPPRRRR